MIGTWVKYASIAVCLGILAGCIPRASLQGPLQASKEQVIVNTILDVQTGQFIDKAKLFDHILSSEYLLLGETHDNGHHHKLQANIVDQLRQQQPSASVSFEMITYQQGKLLKQHAFSSSSELIKILDLAENNWPYKRDYQRVFDSVLLAGFDILPANLNVNRLVQISMQGDAGMPENARQILKKTPLSTKHRADLLDEIMLAHCNKLPEEATRPMVEIQRLRDAVMSMSLLNSNAETKVLIAGAGHTRNDRGVPLYLRSHNREASIVSIGFLEVKQDAESIDAYGQRWGGQTLPFDYVWFTPAVQRQQDPCDAIEAQVKQ